MLKKMYLQFLNVVELGVKGSDGNDSSLDKIMEDSYLVNTKYYGPTEGNL